MKEKGIILKISKNLFFSTNILITYLVNYTKKLTISENKQSRKLEYRWSYQPEENSESLLGNTISNSAEYTRHHRKKHLKNLCN